MKKLKVLLITLIFALAIYASMALINGLEREEKEPKASKSRSLDDDKKTPKEIKKEEPKKQEPKKASTHSNKNDEYVANTPRVIVNDIPQETNKVVKVEVKGSTKDQSDLHIEAPEGYVPPSQKVEEHHTHKHNYKVENVVKPNCTTEGYTTYACDCGDKYNSDKTPKTKHNFIITKDDKYITYFCSGCGYSYKEELKNNPSIEETKPSAPTTQEHTCDKNDGHQHIEKKAGNITYIYCEQVKKPFKSSDNLTYFYPFRHYVG